MQIHGVESYIKEVSAILEGELQLRLSKELGEVAERVQKQVLSKFLVNAERSFKLSLIQKPEYRDMFELKVIVEVIGGKSDPS